ncbi:hypothetical protein PanWU01x14_154430, partial [Parasponia andersonii]
PPKLPPLPLFTRSCSDHRTARRTAPRPYPAADESTPSAAVSLCRLSLEIEHSESLITGPIFRPLFLPPMSDHLTTTARLVSTPAFIANHLDLQLGSNEKLTTVAIF